MLTYRSLLAPIRPTSPPPLLSDHTDTARRLCEYCNKIAFHFREISGYVRRKERVKPVEYARLDYYPNFPNLKAAAERGCACCGLLRYTIRQNWSLRAFTEYGVGDLNGSTPLYAEFLATAWDGQITIDDLRFVISSTIAEQVKYLTLRVTPSAYNKIKGFRVIEHHQDTIDTLDQISAEFVLKVYKPTSSSASLLRP
jgi:hypothetical protein